jgi:N-sulfoglucosamine sulfohydrolase
MNPHAAGMLGLAHRGFSLKDPGQHLAQHLRQNGYETVLCGVQHLITPGEEEKLGYEYVLEGDGLPRKDPGSNLAMAMDKRNAMAAAAYLSKPKEQPFFLSFGMNCTHFPLPDPPEDINPDTIQPPAPLPDIPAIRLDMAGYHTLAQHADHCVGTVLKAVREHGLEDDTLMLFTTDHGIAFPWMKCTLYDHGLGVALILRFPKKEFAGNVVDSLVSHLDIYPTLCELTQTEKPAWLEGSSVMPLIQGTQETIRSEIYGEVTYHAAYEPMRCVRTGRYKYIRNFGDYPQVIKANIDDSRSKRFLLDNGLMNQPHAPTEMLFDLYFDPAERENLAGRKEFTQIKDQMAERLQRWMIETEDPLLSGDVPLPSGGYANPPDDIHPS